MLANKQLQNNFRSAFND